MRLRNIEQLHPKLFTQETAESTQISCSASFHTTTDPSYTALSLRLRGWIHFKIYGTIKQTSLVFFLFC